MGDVYGVDAKPESIEFYFNRSVISRAQTKGDISNWDAMSDQNGCTSIAASDIATKDVKIGEIKFNFGIEFCFLQQENISSVLFDKICEKSFPGY